MIDSTNKQQPYLDYAPSVEGQADGLDQHNFSMTRRRALHGLIVGVGATITLAGCPSFERVSNFSGAGYFTEDEMKLLSILSDLIIPATDTPGAVQAKVPEFIDGLMTNWANNATRRAQRKALRAIDHALQDLARTDFLHLGAAQAEATLTMFDQLAYQDEAKGTTEYRKLKSLIANAYFSSQPGLEQERQWHAVPGRWDASLPLTTPTTHPEGTNHG